MLGVGFEPTPPKRTELKSAALDPSAIQAIFIYFIIIIFYADIIHANDSSGIRTHAGKTYQISNLAP